MIEYTVKVDRHGTEHWYLNSQRHREDGPAVEHPALKTAKILLVEF